MSKMQRTKGAAFERLIAKLAREHDIPATRVAPMQAATLNGHRFADVEIGNWQVECKHHQKVSVVSHDDWTDSPGKVLIYRHNGRRPKVVMDYDDFLQLVKRDMENRYPDG